MKTLICFYEMNKFIRSTSYELLTCKNDQTVSDFLKSIEQKFPDEMKIVQINFEYEHQDLFKHQESLYEVAKASIFILRKYEILSADAIVEALIGANEELYFAPLESKSNFLEKVETIKNEIAAGRLYQANLTAPLKSASEITDEQIFKKYFSYLNGDYKALLPLQNLEIISFSPELFLQKKDGKLITRPIKGSLAQGQNFASELLKNKKEEAELSMIVDLLRNDLNHLEPNDSAQVTNHRAPIELGYIQHTYSEIQIKTQKSLWEILHCTLPGGSISGCPKLESLKVISELEKYRRQVYTGTLGWWKGSDFCLNLAIRTFIRFKNHVFYHSGCGIVYDSDAEKEWNEFLLKTGKLNDSV
jgi:para-aminobenzoate synthetase component 1